MPDEEIGRHADVLVRCHRTSRSGSRCGAISTDERPECPPPWSRHAYFFGFGGAAPGIFWLGADAFVFGGAAFFDLPLLSFMILSLADPTGDLLT